MCLLCVCVWVLGLFCVWGRGAQSHSNGLVTPSGTRLSVFLAVPKVSAVWFCMLYLFSRAGRCSQPRGSSLPGCTSFWFFVVGRLVLLVTYPSPGGPLSWRFPLLVYGYWSARQGAPSYDTVICCLFVCACVRTWVCISVLEAHP